MSAPASPTISFSSATQSANEGAGNVNVTLNINPAPAADETVTIRIDVANSTATYPADYTTTPAATANQFTVNIPSGATTATFAVNIVDDAITETNETIKFDINAVSAGLTIGSTASTVFTIIDNDIVQITIAEVQATTGGDLSDKEGEVVTIGGRVSAIKSGGGFFIQDNPGAWNGIYVFDGGVNTVVRGDSVIVTGTVVEFAPGGSTEKSTQITTLTSFINEGNYAPYAATPLSTNAINAEMYEGVLVSVQMVQ
jgi:predicted extracellular nuclease